MSLQFPLYTVDAFTKHSFTGNSAAVCLVGERTIKEETMQNMASEMNISETAFIELINQGDTYEASSKFKLRWFTPTNEVPLCGHATLASAAVLFFQRKNANKIVTFSTLSGDLYTQQNGDKISLNLPLNEPSAIEAQLESNIKQLYPYIFERAYEEWVENVVLSNTTKKLLIQIKNQYTKTDLKSLQPNFEKMLCHHNGSIYKGVIVTLKGNNDYYDFYSRYFAPWNGINEDPVTGSAHTVLTPYWNKILKKSDMTARQCSKRGGDLYLSLTDNKRVLVSGNATVVLEGLININA